MHKARFNVQLELGAFWHAILPMAAGMLLLSYPLRFKVCRLTACVGPFDRGQKGEWKGKNHSLCLFRICSQSRTPPYVSSVEPDAVIIILRDFTYVCANGYTIPVALEFRSGHKYRTKSPTYVQCTSHCLVRHPYS